MSSEHDSEGPSTFSASTKMGNLASDNVDEAMMATVVSVSTTMIPPSSFAVFPDLPFELRREIWLQAAEGTDPRVVEVVISSDSFKPKSQTSSPAVLSACHESREAALKVFEEVYYGGQSTGAMINWERDTLFFNTDIESGKRLLSNAKHPDWFLECRHLALNRVAFYGAALARHHSPLFRELKNIEELIVVIDGDVIGGQPPERKSVKFALAEAGAEVRKYERTGDHLAYALFQCPHIPRGLLVQEVGSKASEDALERGEKIVPAGSIFQQPATS